MTTSAGDRLRALAHDDDTTILPGVWDPLAAMLAVEAGFDGVFLSGFATSATLLGLPDLGYMTQTEIADAARRVCRRVGGAPVLVDTDTGYGNALNVSRTVELLEGAGAAGMVLEDQVWPKRCGHLAGKRVVAAEDWLLKLKAAVDERETLFVVARTDARGAIGIDEAVERARRAADLGVDAVLVEAPASVAEFEQVAAAVDGPVLVANMVESGRTPLLDTAELRDLGFSIMLSSVAGLFASTKAVLGFWTQLRKHGTSRDHLEEMATFEEFGALIRTDDHHELEARYTD